MAEVQAAKRPAGGAYGQWLQANRTSLAAQAAKEGMTGVTAVTKKAGDVWKKMSDADKAPWEAKYKEAQAAYEAYKNSDGFVPPEKKAKRGKGDKPKKVKDAEAPKKPVGGAYGIFVAEKREEFGKTAAARGEKGVGAVSRLASEAFKALGEGEKAAYEKRAAKAMEEYKKAVAAYAEKKAAEGGCDEEISEGSPAKATGKAEAKATPKKRAAPEGSAVPAAKRSPAAAGKAEAAMTTTPKGKAKAKAKAEGKKEASPQGKARAKGKAKGKDGDAPALPAETLAIAEKEGLRSQLENLASRPDVQAKGLEPAAMLQALRSCAGLVNRARAQLLGK